MKDSSRRYPLRVLPGVMLASLVGVASAHAQSSTFFVATARTIAGPGDVNVLCDGVPKNGLLDRCRKGVRHGAE
jgi:hypothetical protein